MSKSYTIPVKSNFLELHKDPLYIDFLIDSLYSGLSGDLEKFKDIIRYVKKFKINFHKIDK